MDDPVYAVATTNGRTIVRLVIHNEDHISVRRGDFHIAVRRLPDGEQIGSRQVDGSVILQAQHQQHRIALQVGTTPPPEADPFKVLEGLIEPLRIAHFLAKTMERGREDVRPTIEALAAGTKQVVIEGDVVKIIDAVPSKPLESMWKHFPGGRRPCS